MSAVNHLSEHLLTLGGTKALVDAQDPHISLILEKGKEQSPRSAISAHGHPIQCHSNVCALHDANPHVHVHTGYALSDDGIWRPHSWARTGGRVIETTEPRIKYFGVRLRGTALDDFKFYNT